MPGGKGIDTGKEREEGKQERDKRIEDNAVKRNGK